jgi:hypothetical protein
MSRRNKNKRGKKGSSAVPRRFGQQMDITSFVANAVSLSTLGVTPVYQDVSYDAGWFGSRVAAMGTIFAMTRLVHLELEFSPSNITNIDVVSYQPGYLATSGPASWLDVGEMTYSRMWLPNTTVARKFVVTRKMLMGETQLKWYNTGNRNTTIDSQGRIWMCSNVAAQTLVVRSRAVFEFCSSVTLNQDSIKKLQLDFERSVKITQTVLPEDDEKFVSVPRDLTPQGTDVD